MTQPRDSHGRFKADHRARNIAIGTATAIGAVASGVGAALHFGLFDRWLGREDQDAETVAAQLSREALRPATRPVPEPSDLRSEPAQLAELAEAHPS